MKFSLTKKQLLSITLILGLMVSLVLALRLAGTRQEIRKKAAGAVMSLSLYPVTETIGIGQAKLFELKAAFTNGSSTEKLDYFRTELSFNPNYIKAPDGKYIDTSMSGFGKIIRVDGPTAANEAGKMIIELGAISSGAGPATDKPITIAKLYFEGKGATPSSQDVKIGETQAVNNQSGGVNVTSQSAKYLVTLSTGPTPTPVTISDNFDGGSLDSNNWKIYSNNSQIVIGSAIKQELGVLRFKVPTGINQFTGLSADGNEVTGDFEATVDATIEQGGEPWGSDTYMMLHDDPWENGIFISIRKESGNKVIVKADSKIGQHVEVGKADISTTGPVTLKMKRAGDVGTWYYKVTGGDFILLATANNVYKGNGRISLGNNTWEANFPSVTSTFDNFSAKVNFLSVPTSTPTPTPTPTPIQQATCLTLPAPDTFDAAAINTNFWNYWSSGAGSVNQNSGVLKAILPGGGFQGVSTINKVCGDFDTRVDFNRFTSSGQPEGDARLIITDQTLNENNVEVLIQRYSKGNEQGFWTDMKKPDGTYFGGTGANSTATTGKLRIRRQGSVFTTYYDDGGGWKKLGYYASGFSSDAHIIITVGSYGQNPSVSANFDNFNLTTAIPDPSVTPIPTNTPVPTATPSPTPPSGREKYIIDVGDKQSLVINIGPAINPQIKFKAKLASLRAYPELYLKLRVKDELAFLDKQNSSAVSTDTCNNPTAPDKDFYIPMKATGDVYSPVQQISQPAPAGAAVASVGGDGWVILDGMVPGRYYSLFLKGPKTRKSKMVEHFLLQPNQISTQDFDWTGKLLDPGDLPDPANGNKQDCTINSADWSLEKARIGSTDGTNLAVCDVNYDGICNAGDSVAILDTLSKRPDDDF